MGAKKEKDSVDIKIALLRSILKNEVKLRLHKNIKKYTSLKEELENVMDRYLTNAMDSYTTIADLIERAKQLQEEYHRIIELGLNYEELTFIILYFKKSNYQRKWTNSGYCLWCSKSNLQIDWMNKEDTKASIRLAVKKELRGKVSFAKLNEILQDVMEQAEGQYS